MLELINVFWQIFKSTWQIWIFILSFVLLMLLIDYFFKWLEEWKNKRWLEKHRKLEDWRKLDGREFEKVVATIYRNLGYKTKITGGPKDYGIDIIAIKDRKRNFIQCKQMETVSPKYVREFYGSIVDRFREGEKGILVTTGDFTEQSREEAKDRRIELIGGLRLEKLANQF